MIDEDHCVYVKRSMEKFIIISLYIDDILLAGNDKVFVRAIKEWLSSNFEMKDMGEVDYILGVKKHRDCSKKLLTFSQESYIRKILEHFNMKYYYPIDTSVVKNKCLSLAMCPKALQEKK